MSLRETLFTFILEYIAESVLSYFDISEEVVFYFCCVHDMDFLQLILITNNDLLLMANNNKITDNLTFLYI